VKTWWKEIGGFAQLQPSLLDSFGTRGPISLAELLDYSVVTGVSSLYRMGLNSGEVWSV
jgi:hypothetical protein